MFSPYQIVKKSVFLKHLRLRDILLSIIFLIILVFVVIQKEILTAPKNIVFLLTGTSASLFVLSVIRERIVRYPPLITYLFLSFLVWMGISSSFSKDIGESIWEFVKTASFFFLFLAIYNMVWKKPHVQKFLIVGFLVIAISILALDFYDYVTIGGLKAGSHFVGSLNWHNQMAGFLLFVTPLLFSIFLTSKAKKIKLLVLFLVIFTIFAMIVTYSRGGWLSFIGSLILLMLIGFKKIRQNAKYFIFMTTILIFLVMFLTKKESVVERTKEIQVEALQETRTVSGNLRFTVIENAVLMLKDYPLFGVGPGAFGTMYYVYQKDPWLYARYAHNHYVQIAAELGIPGILLFLAIITVSIYTAFLAKSGIFDDKKYPFLLGIITAFFATSAHAFIDFDWSRISLFSLFIMILAFLFANSPIKERKIKMEKFSVFLYFIPIMLIATTWALYQAENEYIQARNLYDKENYKEAKIHAEKSITYNPFDGDYYLLLGQIHYLQKQYGDAKKNYEKTIRYSPFQAQAFYNMGVLEFNQHKNYEESKRLFAKSIKLTPFSDLNFYMALANTYSNLKEDKMAEKTLEKALFEAYPLDESFKGFKYMYDFTGFTKQLAGVYLRLAVIKIELGKKEEAKKLIEIVEKELDPKNPAIPIFKKIVSGI